MLAGDTKLTLKVMIAEKTHRYCVERRAGALEADRLERTTTWREGKRSQGPQTMKREAYTAIEDCRRRW